MKSCYTKEDAARDAVAECFWGDYTFTDQDILQMVEEHSPYTDRFLIRRIVDNAIWPSRVLRALFPRERILRAIEEPVASHASAYHERRHRLVRANLTGNYALVPERQWPDRR